MSEEVTKSYNHETLFKEVAYKAKLEAAQRRYDEFRKKQGEYFQLSADYARALGAGTATETQRVKLVAAREAYYSA